MNKVTCHLMGGLGNYLFQIAVAYNYGLKHDKTPIFNINDSVNVHRHLITYKDNILSNVQFTDKQINYNGYNEINFHYDEIPFIDGNVLLCGYFQSEKYFKDNISEIRRLFQYPKQHIDNILNKYGNILKNKTCSIHVRRGNYLNLQQYHPVQDINYFNKSIEIIPEDSYFLIFSDDIPWCKIHFPNNDKFIFIEGNNDYDDLLLMSLCDNNIISNSTFSWWGAWFNNNPNKIVVSPQKWFGPANSKLNTKDLYCENWFKI